MRVANDAKCFVLSEAVDGAAAPPAELDRSRPDVVFGATLGTGVGGGIVVDGRVLTGENGSATEWSHTTLPFAAPDETSPYPCVCGHPRCIESFISGRGLEGTYRALGGGELRGETIGQRADAGDDIAARAFALYEDRLARALASVINLIDPRVSSSEAGSPTTPASSPTSPSSWNATPWPRAYAQSWSTPPTATPAASEAQPGSGHLRPDA